MTKQKKNIFFKSDMKFQKSKKE